MAHRPRRRVSRQPGRDPARSGAGIQRATQTFKGTVGGAATKSSRFGGVATGRAFARLESAERVAAQNKAFRDQERRTAALPSAAEGQKGFGNVIPTLQASLLSKTTNNPLLLAIPLPFGKGKLAFAGAKKALARIGLGKGAKVPKSLKDLGSQVLPPGAKAGEEALERSASIDAQKLLGTGKDKLNEEILERGLFPNIKNFADEGAENLAIQGLKEVRKFKSALAKSRENLLGKGPALAGVERAANGAQEARITNMFIKELTRQQVPFSFKFTKQMTDFITKFNTKTGEIVTNVVVRSATRGSRTILPSLNGKSAGLLASIIGGGGAATFNLIALTGVAVALLYGRSEATEGTNVPGLAIIKDGIFNNDFRTVVEGVRLVQTGQDNFNNRTGADAIPGFGDLLVKGKNNILGGQGMIDWGTQEATKMLQIEEWEAAGGQPNFTTNEGEEVFITSDNQIIRRPMTSDEWTVTQSIEVAEFKSKLDKELIVLREQSKFKGLRLEFALGKELAEFQLKLFFERQKEIERLQELNVQRWIEYLKIKAKLAAESGRSNLNFGGGLF